MGKNRKPLSSIERFQSFVDGLWDGSSIRLGTELTRADKLAHFGVLVFRSFIRNRCPVHAYALSYTTLLALVPMLAVVLSLTSSMLKGESEERIGQFIDRLVMTVVPPGTESQDESWIATNNLTEMQGPPTIAETMVATNDATSTNITVVATTNAPSKAELAIAKIVQKPEAQEVRKEAARKIRQFIENTWSGTMGTVGTILLLYIAFGMLARIEDTFNDIWGVAHGRPWFMRIVLYWAVISLVPLLVIAALTLASGRHLSGAREFIAQTAFIGELIFRFTPLLLLWLTFSAFYKLVPNTKIDWAAALVGGGVCAVLWHVNNSFSALYVSRVVTNSKIYGSLGLVPVMMIGLYFSWFFLLLGAQFAYAWQNRSAYLQEKLAERVDQRGREFVALRLMTCVGQYFQAGEAAASVSELSGTLGVPSRLTQQIMQTLKASQLVAEVGGRETGYLPARPLDTITCYDVLLALRTTNNQPLPKRDEPATNEVLGEFERIQAAERHAATSVTLAALVDRAQARLRLAAPAPSELVTSPPPVPPVEPLKPAVAASVPGDAIKLHSSEFVPAEVPQASRDDSAAPTPPPQAKPGGPEFVSIQLPSTNQQRIEDEERSFPL